MRELDYPRFDFSLGDPLLPMSYAANYAFSRIKEDLHEYRILEQNSAEFPIGKTLENVVEYFASRGIEASFPEKLQLRNILLTNGTTEAFELIIRTLAKRFNYWNDKHARGLKPAIIMPVPTYGFFFKNLNTWGIELIPVERDLKNGGRLRPQDLEAAFEKAFIEEKRVIAFFDSNPNNPTGLVRGREETEELAAIIQKWSKLDMHSDNDWFSEKGIRDFGPAIKIIDDMVYDGLQYDPENQPVGFAQICESNPYTVHHTYTLFGGSKAGLAGMRIGLLIGGSADVDEMRNILSSTCYFPSSMSYHAGAVFFTNEKKFSKKREKHLKKLNEEHQIRGKLMKCLINGLAKTPEVTKDDFEKLTDVVSQNSGDVSKARGMLISGIEGVEIITTPDAGFFHLIDFSGLKEMPYNDVIFKHQLGYFSDAQRNEYIEDNGLRDFDNHRIENLRTLQEFTGFNLAWPAWMGMNKNSMIARVTFAKPLEDIVEFGLRISELSTALMAQQKPKLQATATLQPAI